MQGITDSDYMHAQHCKDLEIKNLGECHDLYHKSDTFWLMFLKTSEKCV